MRTRELARDKDTSRSCYCQILDEKGACRDTICPSALPDVEEGIWLVVVVGDSLWFAHVVVMHGCESRTDLELVNRMQPNHSDALSMGAIRPPAKFLPSRRHNSLIDTVRMPFFMISIVLTSLP